MSTEVKKARNMHFNSEAMERFNQLFPGMDDSGAIFGVEDDSPCSYVINSFPGLYQLTLAELKEKNFTPGELCSIIDTFNASSIDGRFAGQDLIFSMEDSIALDHMDVKWEYESEEFLAKLRELTVFQSATLTLWAKCFWFQNHFEQSDLEAYVKTLTIN